MLTTALASHLSPDRPTRSVTKTITAALIRRKEVQRRTSLSRSQLYALMQKGAFPKQVSLGPKSAAWLDTEVDDWVHQRLAQRTVTA